MAATVVCVHFDDEPSKGVGEDKEPVKAKLQEVLEVVASHALANEGAVVVHVLRARFAGGAVVHELVQPSSSTLLADVLALASRLLRVDWRTRQAARVCDCGPVERHKNNRRQGANHHLVHEQLVWVVVIPHVVEPNPRQGCAKKGS